MMIIQYSILPTVQSEIRELKGEISHQSKRNFMLEKDLRFLDSKIALLINHKITIEVSHAWYHCIHVTTVTTACFLLWPPPNLYLRDPYPPPHLTSISGTLTLLPSTLVPGIPPHIVSPHPSKYPFYSTF